MLTVIVGTTSALIFGAADFLGGLAARRTSAILVTALTALTALAAATGLVVLLLALPIVGGEWSMPAVLLGAASGVAGAVAIGLLYACLAIGPMSILSPLTAVVSAVVPLTFGLIGGERLGMLGYVRTGVRATRRLPRLTRRAQADTAARLPRSTDVRTDFLTLLGSPNLSDKSWVTNQYDRYVMGNTALSFPDDGGMVRVDEESGLGFAVATDANGRYCQLDPYLGAQLALAEAYRNVAATGARPVAVSDCLNFGSPENPEVMWQFSRAVEGLADGCLELDIPVTGGNVSFYNQTGDVPIHPNGSAWTGTIHGHLGGLPPRVDLGAEKKLAALISAGGGESLLASAHDLADGGLGQARRSRSALRHRRPRLDHRDHGA